MIPSAIARGLALVASIIGPAPAGEVVFPGAEWQHKDPGELGLDAETLDRFAEALGGRGCVVRDGFMVKTWGDQAERSDWYSSVKPLLSTLLFFAIEEGRVEGVDQPVADFGWDLRPEDRAITFRHLADMTSGYARPDPPGAAWAYNDFGIQLYQRTLFDRVFRDDPERVACDPGRLGPLQFQDGLAFDPRRRLVASVRDFARIDWFWLNRGRWGDRQLLPGGYFDAYLRPDVPPGLPHTAEGETDDYLGIGSFGGGSDHFTRFGPGIYGFNWWFNARGRLNPDAPTWPDAPPDAIMTIGFGGNCSVILPGHRIVVASARGDWGELAPGDPDAPMNRRLRLLLQAVREPAE